MDKQKNKHDDYTDEITKKAVGRLLDDYIKDDEINYFSPKQEYVEYDDEYEYSEGFIEDEEDFEEDDNYLSAYDDNEYEKVSRYSPRRSRQGRGGKTKKAKKKNNAALSSKSSRDVREVSAKNKASYSYKSNIGKIILGVIIVLFLVVLSVLIFKINSLSAKLEQSEKKLEEMQQKYGQDSESELEKLKKQVSDLQKENESLLGNSNKNADSSTESVSTEQSSSAQTADYSNLPAEYVVQKGDNLWKISEKVYGDGHMYTKIAEANNISTDGGLYTGQKLTIPKI